MSSKPSRRKSEAQERKKSLEEQLARAKADLQRESLLERVWIELGPYTPHLSRELRHELQDYFGFDDSE